MTLLEHREQALAEKLDDVLHLASDLRKCVEGGFADTHMRLCALDNSTREARVLMAQVRDLRDVAKYGECGGRQ